MCYFFALRIANLSDFIVLSCSDFVCQQTHLSETVTITTCLVYNLNEH